MKVIDRIHEILIRRIDKTNPDSDYYEIYPVTTADNVYMTYDQDESLAEFLINLRFTYKRFIENINYPVDSVQVWNAHENSWGQLMYGDIVLKAADFGLGLVDNTRDIDKIVSTLQKQHVDDALAVIREEIAKINTYIPLWETHMDYTITRNPHRVTWEEVVNDPNVTIKPTELVDETRVRKAIDDHNNADWDPDNPTHPKIWDRIVAIEEQIEEVDEGLDILKNDLVSQIQGIASNLINTHDSTPGAHSDIYNFLLQMQNTVALAIAEYEGLNGIELVARKVDTIDPVKAVSFIRGPAGVTDLTPDDEYHDLYPTVNALRNLLAELNLNIFTNVDHLPAVTTTTLNSTIASKANGILFADRFNTEEGSWIWIYKQGQILTSYKVPKPLPAITVDKKLAAPDVTSLIAEYGINQRVILFCDQSSTNTKLQSIVVWQGGLRKEFVMNRMTLEPGEHVWQAEHHSTNVGYDLPTLFPHGYGVLFVNDLDNSGKNGAVIYNKDNNPTTQKMEFSVRNDAVVMVESNTSPTTANIATLLPPDGNGLVYVNNLYSAGSGIPGIEYWRNGNREIQKAIPKNGFDSIRVNVNGTGTAQSQTINLSKTYASVAGMKCSIGLAGINTNNIIAPNIVAQGVVTSNTQNTVTISTTVTSGVSAIFYVDVMGILP